MHSYTCFFGCKLFTFSNEMLDHHHHYYGYYYCCYYYYHHPISCILHRFKLCTISSGPRGLELKMSWFQTTHINIQPNLQIKFLPD